VWIVQEVTVANDLAIYVGEHHLDLERLGEGEEYLSSRRRTSYRESRKTGSGFGKSRLLLSEQDGG
jgi:hypothetical protein